MGLFRSKGSEGGDRRTATVEERLAAIQPGAPGHCPSCDGLGYIDNLDIGGRFQIQHCKDCGHRWEYLFDADGQVVGLTELDDEGQPVARMRVRTRPLVADRRTAPAEPPVEAPAEPPVEASVEPPVEASVDEPAPLLHVGQIADAVDDADDDVLDLRDPAPTAEAAADVEVDDAESTPEQMSAAEWLRHAVGR
ncbi:MAG: hypothetical protein ACLGIC_02330 [Acidimicrobiia bacterium]